VAESRSTRIALEQVERGLDIEVSEAGVIACVEDDMARIAEASLQTVAMAGLEAAQVDAVYFTGGSTGLAPLAQRIAGQFASAQVVRGHRFASVAQGLGHHAHRQFSTA
jgi:hypothetical chaperone protein